MCRKKNIKEKGPFPSKFIGTDPTSAKPKPSSLQKRRKLPASVPEEVETNYIPNEKVFMQSKSTIKSQVEKGKPVKKERLQPKRTAKKSISTLAKQKSDTPIYIGA